MMKKVIYLLMVIAVIACTKQDDKTVNLTSQELEEIQNLLDQTRWVMWNAGIDSNIIEENVENLKRYYVSETLLQKGVELDEKEWRIAVDIVKTKLR